MGEGSFSIQYGSRLGYRQGRVWLHVAVVIALVLTQLVFVSGSAEAGHEITGMGEETASVTSRVKFNTFESSEVQWVWNDTDPDEIQNITHNHTAGTFTLSFDGEGPTGPIPFNDDGSTIKSELELFAGITTVTVTENAVGDWDVEFIDPGETDVPEMTGDPTLLVGGDSFEITTPREGGPGGTFTLTFGSETTAPLDWDASDAQVEAALKALTKLDEVTVSGSGNAGDEWIVTFAYAVPELTKTDSLLNGSTSINTVTPGTSAPIDPSGLTWVGASLVLSDSEIEEEETVYDDVNMWSLTTTPVITEIGKFEHGSAEPTGLAFNPAGNGHLYISNDDSDRVYDVDLGLNGTFDTFDDFTCVDTTLFGVLDPEDVAWDAELGQLFIASGIGGQFDDFPRTVTAISPGADGTLGSAPNDCLLGGDDVAGSPMDFTALMGDLEGLEYRTASDTLLLIDPTNCEGLCQERIYEITKDGRVIRTIHIPETRAPSDAVLAPNGTTMYLVDRGSDNNSTEPPPRDGEWFEYEVDFHNLAPYVEAGVNQTVGFGDPAALVGDSYDDGQGSIYTAPPFEPDVTWSKVSGPGNVVFDDANALSTNANFSLAGVYVLKLSSTDGDNTTEDTVTVTMSPDPNQPPTANAGPDQVITLPSVANLSGTANDDGMPDPPGTLTTEWSKVSGPGTVTFGDKAALMTTASFSTAGTYVLKLTANDSAKQHSDTMTVTVNPAPPPPPNTSIVGGVEQSSGIWRLFDGGVQTTSFYYGNPNDFPFYGDWDCDGDETPGLYRQSDGYVYLRNSNTQGIADISFFFGNPGDVPMAGDFNGDGCDTVSIYRPSEAKFYIINELGSADKGLGAAEYSFFYGVPGDVPFVGDWTGNGIDTPGLRRDSDGFVYLRNTNTQGIADVDYFYGNNGDVVFAGDWDGDGDDTLGLYRPSNGVMYLRNTNSTGIADFDFFAGFGLYPVAGDH